MKPILSRHDLSEWDEKKEGISTEEKILNLFLDELNPPNKEQFFNSDLRHLPDPFLAKGMADSVLRFCKALQNHERILIVGDYDADGITSSALICRFLQYTGHQNYELFIPSRFRHGYGLTQATVTEVLQKQPNLVLTVDNGISSFQEVENLKQNGIEILVTDHHLPVEDNEPDCLIVNPQQKNCSYPYKNLSGAGVVFLFMIALRRTLRKQNFWNEERPEPNLSSDLDLVCIGTLADQMLVDGINRVLITYGLRQMQRVFMSDQKGIEPKYNYLRALKQEFFYLEANTETIIYKIAPLLNAAGRISEAQESVDFLLSSSLSKASEKLKTLIDLNHSRKNTLTDMQEKADKIAAEQHKNGGIFIYNESFHEGIIGILAGKFSEMYQVPTVIMTKSKKGHWKGSCRSIKGVSILKILGENKKYLTTYGGHDCAAGVQTIDEHIKALQSSYFQSCSHLKKTQQQSGFMGDVELNSKAIHMGLYDALRLLEPFGKGNPKPILVLRNLNLDDARLIGTDHVKWKKPGMEIIFWNGSEHDFNGINWDIAFEVNKNKFQGRETLQLVIKHVCSNKNYT